jgi:predicted metal-dependent hydrolase
MKSRWGSCSSDGNLNFNIYLKYLPQTLIEYIVFHETTHLIEMSHNKKFWNIISTEYPDYKEKEDELFIYWLRVKKEVKI